MNKARRKAIKEALKDLQALDLDEDTALEPGGAKFVLTEAITALTEVKDEEQDAFDNLSEGFQQADQGQTMESNISEMESAIEELEAVDMDENEDWRTDLQSAIESAASTLEGL